MGYYACPANQKASFGSRDCHMGSHHQITSMAESKVDPSILFNISLWYQNPEVSELFYSLLRDSGHP